MVQYQILARKLLGQSGIGPKQTLEVKNSVATPPQVRRTATPAACTACGTLPHGARATVAHGGGHLHATVAHGGGHLCANRVQAPGSGQIHKETGTSRLAAVDLLIRSTTGNRTPSSICTRRADEFDTNGISTTRNRESSTCVTFNGSGIKLAVGSQPLRLRNHNFGLIHRIMVKSLATSPHDPLGITDSACKNQLVMISVQYGPFNTYIPIRSATIGKSRVARDPIAMHTSWRSNSDITSVTRVSMTFRVVRTNQYNQDLGLIHSTNGNHLESPNEGSSIDHQVTIHLHAQNITMFPTNETWYFTSQMLVSSSGDLILILTAQSTRNEFRIHSDY
ncbi:hypothetical protein F511_37108 [Dorcoceras hygrometricum]|uniref:Triacylglycerol lipase n=1 Tax=Dorcoceras hygrometricum TaxID=472368 RepID=A0A2Z7BNF0_9LAMI|nr:hypothetical protein F511_37108 [Dorcoceras hygrometricum]